MKKVLLTFIAVLGVVSAANAQSIKRGSYDKNAGQPEIARVVKLQKAEARGNELAGMKLDAISNLEEALAESMYITVKISPTGASQNRLADGALVSVAGPYVKFGTKVVASIDFGQHNSKVSFTNADLLVDSMTNIPGKATKPYKWNSVNGVLNYFASKGFVIDREMGGKGFKFGRLGYYTLVKKSM